MWTSASGDNIDSRSCSGSGSKPVVFLFTFYWHLKWILSIVMWDVMWYRTSFSFLPSSATLHIYISSSSTFALLRFSYLHLHHLILIIYQVLTVKSNCAPVSTFVSMSFPTFTLLLSLPPSSLATDRALVLCIHVHAYSTSVCYNVHVITILRRRGSDIDLRLGWFVEPYLSFQILHVFYLCFSSFPHYHHHKVCMWDGHTRKIRGDGADDDDDFDVRDSASPSWSIQVRELTHICFSNRTQPNQPPAFS